MIQYSPVFIVGVPRSGTTLFSLMLSAHSRIAISPETHYFEKFVKKCRRQCCLKSQVRYERFVARFLSCDELRPFGFSPPDIEAVKSQILRKEPSHRWILETVLRRYAANCGKEIWGEKTPGHADHVDRILGLFPSARIVQLVRDPRDVFLSLNRVPWGRGNVVAVIRRWLRYVSLPQRHSGLNSSNYIALRYEDLLTDPRTTLETVCRFLGVAFEQDMLRHSEVSRPNYDSTAEPWKVNSRNPIDQGNQYKWRGVLSVREQNLFRMMAAPELVAWGYDLGGQELRLSDRVYALKRHCENSMFITFHHLKRVSRVLGKNGIA